MTTELPMLPISGVEDRSPEISLNGESITIRLIALAATKVPLQFQRDALSTFVSRLTRAHLLAEAIARSRGAPVEMPTVEADRAHAESPIGAPFVALTILTHLPMLQHFELTPAQADTLARELQAAARDARKNAETARH